MKTSILTALALSLCLTACGGKTPDDKSDSGTPKDDSGEMAPDSGIEHSDSGELLDAGDFADANDNSHSDAGNPADAGACTAASCQSDAGSACGGAVSGATCVCNQQSGVCELGVPGTGTCESSTDCSVTGQWCGNTDRPVANTAFCSSDSECSAIADYFVGCIDGVCAFNCVPGTCPGSSVCVSISTDAGEISYCALGECYASES